MVFATLYRKVRPFLVADDDFDPGDTRERVTVFDYAAPSIQAFLADPRYPVKPPSIALRQTQFPTTSSRSSPLPAGMDIWPIDGSLLISTNKGTILQYTPAASGFTPSGKAGPVFTSMIFAVLVV